MVFSAQQIQTDQANPSPPNVADLTKDYKCNIGIEFPEIEEEKKQILTNIERVIKSVTSSLIDLDFLRAKILEEHDEEIMFMDF